jgi:hypothetical protein
VQALLARQQRQVQQEPLRLPERLVRQARQKQGSVPAYLLAV